MPDMAAPKNSNGHDVTIAFDPDVLDWIRGMLFPSPESGRVGIQLNPAAEDFDEQAAFVSRVKAQLFPQ